MAAPKIDYLSSEEVVEILENQLLENGYLTSLQEVVFEYHTVCLIREYYKRTHKLTEKEKILVEKLPLLKDEEVYLWFLSLDEVFYTEMVVDSIEGFISEDLFKLCWVDNALYDKIHKFIVDYDGLYWETQDFILQCAYLGGYLKSKGYDNNLNDELVLLGIQHWPLEKIAEYIKIERYNMFLLPKNDIRIDKIMTFIYSNIEEMPVDYELKLKQSTWDDEKKQHIPILDEFGKQAYTTYTMETRLAEMKENLFSFKCYGAKYMRMEYATSTSKLAYLFHCLNKKGYVCNNWQNLIEKRCFFVNKRDKLITARQLGASLNQLKLVADKSKKDKKQQEYEEIKKFVESL